MAIPDSALKAALLNALTVPEILAALTRFERDWSFCFTNC